MWICILSLLKGCTRLAKDIEVIIYSFSHSVANFIIDNLIIAALIEDFTHQWFVIEIILYGHLSKIRMFIATSDKCEQRYNCQSQHLFQYKILFISDGISYLSRHFFQGE